MSQPPPPPPNGPFQPPHGQYPGPGAPPPWPPQGTWPGAQPEPPKRGNGWKWALGAVALVAVIAVTVVVTVVVTGGGSGDDGPPTAAPSANGAQSDIASANDTGPVGVITEDPSCAPVRPILETRAAAQRNGWDKRDPSIPAVSWTAEMRAQHEAVGRSMRKSADQLVPLVKLTPHRVMRELYEQLIVYSRAYADSIPTYTAPDENLALVATSVATAISNICTAIEKGSAAARAPLISLPAAVPSPVAPVGDPADPQRFLTEANAVCADWERVLTEFRSDIEAWMSTDPDIPGSQWTPEQQAINDEIAPVMSRFANQLRVLGARSDNAVLQDFAELSAQYWDVYVKALPTYTPTDNYLASAAAVISGSVEAACLAFGT